MKKASASKLRLASAVLLISGIGLLIVYPPSASTFAMFSLADCTQEERDEPGSPFAKVLKTYVTNNGVQTEGNHLGLAITVPSGATPRMSVLFENETCDTSAIGKFRVVWKVNYGSGYFVEHTSNPRDIGAFERTLFNHTIKTPITGLSTAEISVQVERNGSWIEQDSPKITFMVEGAVDTTPPTVTILSPVSGASIAGPSTIVVTGSTSDNVGVTKIEWSLDGGSYGPGVLSSGGFAITTVPIQVGAHTITVKAFDAAENTKTASVSFTITNNDPPVCIPPQVLQNGQCVTPDPDDMQDTKVLTLAGIGSSALGGIGLFLSTRKK